MKPRGVGLNANQRRAVRQEAAWWQKNQAFAAEYAQTNDPQGDLIQGGPELWKLLDQTDAAFGRTEKEVQK